MKILIKNGRVLNPADNTDSILDLLTCDHSILKIKEHIDDAEADTVIDAGGCYVMPGLIDLHVHLRDPGLTYKETLKTGTQAAAKGGFTTIVAMANTNPVIDTPERLTAFYDHAKTSSLIQVLQVGTVTKGMGGQKLTDIAGLKSAGAPALSEDGKTVANAALFREALSLAAQHGIPVLDHCEDAGIKGKGVITEGLISQELGLPGIPASAEDTITARDLLLAKETGAHVHICHCSTAESTALIRHFKKSGARISAEVCPHHFTLSAEDIAGDDSNYKMAPPLRPRSDVEALIEGLKDGTLDAIASDHAPHAADEKTSDLPSAAFGIVGLETMVPLTISELVETGHLTPLQMAEKMSYNPAKILNISKGCLNEGGDADITVIDPAAAYTIDKETFLSKGRNTPFHGRKVQGRVKATICRGRVVYRHS